MEMRMTKNWVDYGNGNEEELNRLWKWRRIELDMEMEMGFFGLISFFEVIIIHCVIR